MSVTVREATTNDVAAIVALAERAWRAAYGEILDTGTIDAAIDEWYDPGGTREAIEREDVAYYVAVERTPGEVERPAQDILGYVSGHGHEGTARLGAIYVDPQRWGEGIGSALLSRFERFCRERDCARVEFEVLRENEVGQSFYRKRGYEAVDEREIELFGETVREQVFAGALG